MDSVQLTAFEQKIIAAWEEVYKKGLLTLWILLALKNGSKYMSAIKEFIDSAANESLAADDQSMYRALRRFHKIELIEYKEEPSDQGGPARKAYFLTGTGRNVLNGFIKRNIADIYYKPKIQKLLLDK